ncbi:MAG: FHA domain-containing protein [Polyangiaceae bacterium]
MELSEGEFAVGRNASCQLSLDDPLVSRRHALLVVDRHGVTLEDLESRNGVLVNRSRITERVHLEAGDRILIGAQEMTLVAAQESPAERVQGGRSLKMTLPKIPVASNPPPQQEKSESEFELSMVRRADAFNLLGSVAEKALAMGRAVEAERLLASPLGDVIEACRAGKRVTPSLVDQAARFSAKLATATGKGAWADYVIELYSAQRRPCPAPVIDELYSALRRVTSIDIVRLREYIDDLRQRLPTFGPAERFLFQRLEGLERLAATR